MRKKGLHSEEYGYLAVEITIASSNLKFASSLFTVHLIANQSRTCGKRRDSFDLGHCKLRVG